MTQIVTAALSFHSVCCGEVIVAPKIVGTLLVCVTIGPWHNRLADPPATLTVAHSKLIKMASVHTRTIERKSPREVIARRNERAFWESTLKPE
jgi:hypothetical protein